ncbi:MAG TPA: aldo/keto reductase [Steroidobacteraceae bacterium]|nr:aldo/keto reductase [Steroidobacteraceae bacterium]
MPALPEDRAVQWPMHTLTRRDLIALAGAALTVPGAALARTDPLRRAIPSTGERIPVIGLGTWQVLDVPASGAEFDAAASAVRSFLDSGGRLIDSSPMYGRSEERIGDILAHIRPPPGAFLATKIWTSGREAGKAQLAESHRLMRAKVLDLVQVHNLLDLDTHLATLRAAREQGSVRHVGVTHYTQSAHAELERVLRRERPDFLQINYSLAEPEAGARLLPLARDLGVAVLVNRPFTTGSMISRARGKPLPPVADELGCRTAAQLFIKWVLADPAVTVVLAATRNPRHAAENLEAASGAVPSAQQRAAIARWFGGLGG